MMKPKIILLFATGTILFSIALVYVFTHFSIFSSLQVQGSGNIGETIGGITAPVFGLLGAVLIYLSFQVQIEANRIQISKMEEEKRLSTQKAIFDNYLRSFDEIKKTINTIEFVVNHITSNPIPGANHNVFRPDPQKTEYTYVYYHGWAAINEYIRILETGEELDKDYDIKGMELTFKYILNSVNELLKRLNLQISKNNENDDLLFLKNEISIFYYGFLENFLDRALHSPYLYSESVKENPFNHIDQQVPLAKTKLTDELSKLKSEIENNLL